MFSPLKSLLLLNFILIILSRPHTYFDYCSPNGRNSYQVLGVPTNAPYSEIKRIYEALLKQYDYNATPGKYAAARFVELVDCYEILKNQRSRAQYNDECLEDDESHYIPNFDDEFLWGIVIPIIGIIVSQYREKILSFFRKDSMIDEINYFFTDLRYMIDTKERRIAQETNEKRKAKEDGINLAKNQELEILKRYHNDSVGLVGGKTENNEEEESKTLLKSEKEAEFEKIYNRNIQLCESRHSERLKEADEEFNELTEKHAKVFESYRDFISRFEQDVRLKRKGKKTSEEELKEELQVMKMELEAKMSAGELIENNTEERINDDSFLSNYFS